MFNFGVIRPTFFEHAGLQANDGVEFAPLVEEAFGDVMGCVMGRVAGHAESFALEHIGAFAGTRVVDGAAGGGVDGENVVAIDDFRGHVVGRAAVGNIGAGHLQAERGGVGVLIVVADEDDRELLDGGEIDAFVPVAAAGGAVAEVIESDAITAAIAERHGDSGGDGNGGGECADDGDEAVFHVAHMHVAVAAAGKSADTAHVLRQDAAGRDATDQISGQVTMRGKENVFGSGEERGTDRDGFLSTSHIHAADDLALTV